MKTRTANELRLAPIFDRALRHRDQGRLRNATRLLEYLASRLTPTDRSLLLHVYLQLGNVRGKAGDLDTSVVEFRRAAELAPRSELASLALFTGLTRVGSRLDAAREMVRYLELKDSVEYRELLSSGFGLDLPLDELELVVEARRLLQAHEANRPPT